MKKIIGLLILAVSFAGCYEDFRVDYDHTTVAFSPADGGSDTPGVLWRTVVAGEGLDLDFGVYLAGVIENEEERWVDYTIDPQLLAGTSYELMPSDYYTISSPDEFLIPPGEYVGKINIALDSVQFLNDPLTTEPHYAIPFRLTDASTDSILSTNDTKILVIKYMNEYAGAYIQEGSYTTYDADGTEINDGVIDNVINASTTDFSSVRTDGLVFKGPDHMMEMHVGDGGNVELEYFPNPNPDNAPKNVAIEDGDVQLSTSYVAAWECLPCIRDGHEPSSSEDRPQGAYGNWGAPDAANWVEYNFGSNVYNFTLSEIYWWTDNGGILIPDTAYLEYWDMDNEEWVRVENEVGTERDQYNMTELSVTTNRLRMHMESPDGEGILEWKVWGTPVPIVPEQALIESVSVLPNQENSYDPETFTYNLNYRIDYANGDHYTIVSTELAWRNRIRDGVNEWRR